MTPAFYLLTLLAGLVAGWRGRGAVCEGQRRHRPGPPTGVTTPPSDTGGPGRHPLYDWKTDPVIAGCHLCHGTGRVPLFNGHLERCLCGATTWPLRSLASSPVEGPTPPAPTGQVGAREHNGRPA